jgi:hypothetical protein
MLNMKARNNASQKRHRNRNKDELAKVRRQKQRDMKLAARLAVRVGHIAHEAREKFQDAHLFSRYALFQKLYKNTDLDGDRMDPKRVFGTPDYQVTSLTFPMFVALYLPPNKWPKIISAGVVEEGGNYPILKQIPSSEEYHSSVVYSIPMSARGGQPLGEPPSNVVVRQLAEAAHTSMFPRHVMLDRETPTRTLAFAQTTISTAS